MKTLSDFKRALQLGTRWHAIHASGKDLGIRRVSCVQSNSVAFEREDGGESWLDFPKADCFEVKDGTVSIYWPATEYRPQRTLVLTYKQVSDT